MFGGRPDCAGSPPVGPQQAQHRRRVIRNLRTVNTMVDETPRVKAPSLTPRSCRTQTGPGTARWTRPEHRETVKYSDHARSRQAGARTPEPCDCDAGQRTHARFRRRQSPSRNARQDARTRPVQRRAHEVRHTNPARWPLSSSSACAGVGLVPSDLGLAHCGTGCSCAAPLLIRQVRAVQFAETHPPAWHHLIEDAPEPFVVAALNQVDHLVNHDVLHA